MDSEALTLRQEHDAVQAQLASRASTHHLAWAAGLGFLAAILAGVAAKLWWDLSEYHPELYLAALAVTGVVAAVALARLLKGLALARAERERFRRLLELRSRLRLDDPASLLPAEPS